MASFVMLERQHHEIIRDLSKLEVENHTSPTTSSGEDVIKELKGVKVLSLSARKRLSVR